MARTPLLLLPPSEGKAAGGSGDPWEPGSMIAPELDDRRRAAMAALARAMKGSGVRRAKLLGVKGVALEAATAANLDVATAPTCRAIDRYTGVLYDALAYGSRPAPIRRRIDAQVRIFSGLWGLVAPGDPIPDYKLKMGASIGRLGKLSTWWRPAVTAALADEVAGRTVWNLLPNEHAAAWAPDLSPGPASPSAVISVRFFDTVVRGGRPELVSVAHWNKLLKGALVAHVVTEQLTDPSGLCHFAHPLGYRFAPDLTRCDPDGINVSVSLVKP
ncbi:MAG: YaaA family protein [Acidimicrobiales bacterium]